jgi:type IV pilus assembly protein PilC
MAAFHYTAKNVQGHMVRDMVSASTREQALASLRATGLTVLDLARGEAPKAAAVEPAEAPARVPKRLGRARVSLSELAIFCRQLAISVGSGMPLRDALESIAEDVENSGLKRALERVTRRIYDGCSFSEALEEQGKTFGYLMVSLVRSAEEAGSMSETLDQLAGYLERSEKLERKIKSMTAYPMFLAGFFALICVIMTAVVLPRFQSMFSGFEAELPAFTKTVFAFNQMLQDYFVWIGAGLAGTVAVFWLFARTPAGRVTVDALKLRIPVLGPCIKKLAVARFCQNLSIMVRGGVPVASAIDIASGVCGNRVLERGLVQVKDRIVAGSDIASSLAQDPNFPRLVVRMIGVGERSSRLPEVLEKLSDAYENQVENSIMVAMALAEPLCICVFGVVILVMVMAIYLPIFTVASHV